MAFLQTAALLGSLAASAYAHGRVTSIEADGETYTGFINDYIYTPDPPAIVAWSADNGDNGFVDGSAYTSGDIICHREAKAGKISASVAAGSKVEIQWGTDAWPESHHGPIIDYLAKCAGDDCTTVDKETLEFFKIDEAGLIDGSSAPGKWASDELIAADGKWSVTIPESLAPGQYVLRHEIIALHSAGDVNGAQNYPQCFNLEVTGSGTANPEGVLGTALYTPEDAGIKVGIYSALGDSYEIPGPALWDGASSGSSGPATGNSTSGSASPSGVAAPSGSSSNTTVPVATSVPVSQASATQAASSTVTSAPAVTKIADSVPSAALTSTISTALPTPTGTETSEDMPSKPLPEGFTLADLLEWVDYLITKAFSDSVHARDVSRR
ncbi:hypothetical protein Q7P35_008830 [Cladosporium inversicolor]